MSHTTTYTFGDSDLAGRRLRLLADAYARPSRDFLDHGAGGRPDHAVDLGCGPGHSTHLLHRVTGALRTTGLERSPAFLAQARARAEPGIRFVACDVQRPPFPVGDADLLFCRHLLAHVADLHAAVAGWADMVRPGGRLLIQETETLESDDPVLQRYYAAVSAVQAAHGQRIHVGRELDAAIAGGPWFTIDSRVTVVPMPAVAMARLHAMNVRTWREDGAAKLLFSPTDLDGLTAELDTIAGGRRPVEPVQNGLREIVATRA